MTGRSLVASSVVVVVVALLSVLSILSIQYASSQAASTTVTVLAVVTTQFTESYVNQYTVAISSMTPVLAPTTEVFTPHEIVMATVTQTLALATAESVNGWKLWILVAAVPVAILSYVVRRRRTDANPP